MSFPGFSAEASVYRNRSPYVGQMSPFTSDGGVQPQSCVCTGMGEFLCAFCSPAVAGAWAACLPGNLASCTDYQNCVFAVLAATAPFCTSCAASTAKEWCGPCTTCTKCESLDGVGCTCNGAFCGIGNFRCCTDNSVGNPGGGTSSGNVHSGPTCCGSGQKCCGGQCTYDRVLRRPVCSGDCVKAGDPCP